MPNSAKITLRRPAHRKDWFWLVVFVAGTFVFLYLAEIHIFNKEWFMAKPPATIDFFFVALNLVLLAWMVSDIYIFLSRRSTAALGRAFVWGGSLASSLWGLTTLEYRSWLMAFSYLGIATGCAINVAVLIFEPRGFHQDDQTRL